ncbi:hypothetical protein ACWDBW_46865 [Streptomyces sp. NPDC001107]
MSWELALEYIKALIWPIIVLVLGFTFKKQVGGLIGRLQSLETPVGSANFVEKTGAVGQAAAEIGDEISSQLASAGPSGSSEREESNGDRGSLDSFSEILDVDQDVEVRIRSLISREGVDPTSLVLNSWRAVEEAMNKSLKIEAGGSLPIVQLINRVADQGFLSSPLVALVNDLFELRNQVVHGTGPVITRPEAESYQNAARNVIDALKLAESPIYRSMKYEERLFRSLRRLVGGGIEPVGGNSGPADFRITLGDGKSVLIETKYRTRRPFDGKDAGAYLEYVRNQVGSDAGVLIVTNAALSPSARQFNERHSVESPSAEVIQWQGDEDNDYLLRAISRTAR